MKPARSRAWLSLLTGVATLAAAAGVAGCGSSDKSLGEVRACMSKTKIPYTSAVPGRQIQAPIPGGEGAVAIEVDQSEDQARHEAKSWKDFGAAAGKKGVTVVKGKAWVGYPAPVPASTKARIEGCAF